MLEIVRETVVKADSPRVTVDNFNFLPPVTYLDGHLVFVQFTGEGPFIGVYYVVNEKIVKYETTSPAISMGFLINKIIDGENMILFSNLNEDTWSPLNGDNRFETDHAKLEVHLSNGKTYSEDIKDDKGYLIVLPTAEIVDFIQYNSKGEKVNTIEDLEKYGHVGEVIFWN
ncbi:MAG: hypothetical protein ACK4M9_17195 [Anaerobacillus sp.]|uniref:hypothetical protein n=1 Tax=Anaerobacillus sp. TaxID=1872506 RepID=UPI0039188B69